MANDGSLSAADRLAARARHGEEGAAQQSGSWTCGAWVANPPVAPDMQDASDLRSLAHQPRGSQIGPGVARPFGEIAGVWEAETGAHVREVHHRAGTSSDSEPMLHTPNPLTEQEES